MDNNVIIFLNILLKPCVVLVYVLLTCNLLYRKLNEVEDEPESDENDAEEENQDTDFAQAMQKAQKMSASIKKKAKKRKKDEDQDDIVDKYGLDDYDEEESGRMFLKN